MLVRGAIGAAGIQTAMANFLVVVRQCRLLPAGRLIRSTMPGSLFARRLVCIQLAWMNWKMRQTENEADGK